MKNKTMLINNVPKDLHRDIKIVAAREGRKMSEVILSALSEYLYNKNKKDIDRL